MTKEEFKEIARNMGAVVVFSTSATAVFKGPKFTITVELDDVENSHYVDVSDDLDTIAEVVSRGN